MKSVGENATCQKHSQIHLKTRRLSQDDFEKRRAHHGRSLSKNAEVKHRTSGAWLDDSDEFQPCEDCPTSANSSLIPNMMRLRVTRDFFSIYLFEKWANGTKNRSKHTYLNDRKTFGKLAAGFTVFKR